MLYFSCFHVASQLIRLFIIAVNISFEYLALNSSLFFFFVSKTYEFSIYVVFLLVGLETPSVWIFDVDGRMMDRPTDD